MDVDTGGADGGRAAAAGGRMLAVREVADLMRVSRSSVHRLVRAGRLPGVRRGRAVLVPEQAVHDLLRRSW